MKPKHIGGYTSQHVAYCEQTLVTLLHRMGPWKHKVFLVGGMSKAILYRMCPRVSCSIKKEGSTVKSSRWTPLLFIFRHLRFQATMKVS